MRQQVVDALANLPLGQVNAYSRGQIRKMVCDDTAAVHTMVAHLPGDATNAVVSLVAGFGYLLWVDWRVCLVLFGIWIA
ncbi:Iron import ATP-binding/permease protein IrtA [Mobiluncus curtisii]|nr:ABC transporter transmembrane domain-containing protein [Mobiluncus curtisii]SQC01542.1 Iron import ATP-binding/permease protein IrtA [Mobiluncus curtisii]